MIAPLPFRADQAVEPGVDTSVRILLVEDNCDLREYVGRLLRRWWNTEAVGDGAAALEEIRRRRPTLVLADASTPGPDGVGVLCALQRDPVTRSIPVMVLSRDGGAGGADALDPNDCLFKPFSSRELIGRVSARLEQLLGRPVRTRGAVRRLLNKIDVPIAILRNDECLVEHANRAYLDLAGGDGIGKAFLESAPDAAAFARDAVEHVLASGAKHAARELVLPQRRPGGPADSHWSFLFTPVKNDNGVRGQRILAIGVDASDEVSAQRTREADVAEAISANMAKDQFLATLGHELRNPLSPILMALQMMRAKGVSSHELDVVDRQIAVVVRLVDDLLDVARIRHGQVELRKECVEIADVIARAIESVDPLLKERQQRLSVRVPTPGLRANVDPARMAQVFANLLTNAAKYSERGTEIAVRAVRDDHHIRVSVEDRGIGISRDMLPHVFDAFAQARGAARRSHGGLGLGLAIVRHLVALHEGVVTVHSDGPDSGSTFCVELPVRN